MKGCISRCFSTDQWEPKVNFSEPVVKHSHYYEVNYVNLRFHRVYFLKGIKYSTLIASWLFHHYSPETIISALEVIFVYCSCVTWIQDNGASFPKSEFSDVALIAWPSTRWADLHDRNQQMLWMRALLSPPAGCQIFTSAWLPISTPSHLASPNRCKRYTPLPESRREVINLIISSNNYKGQSKQLCRVFFFF